ncbi:peptidoglycan-binding protein [Phenylobacterium sp.]|uniref:peptidoglycan-binding protein n=1 Tax=Phenylobacterium sp. TaxID=1871053 RepID=UPI0035AFFC02
MTSGAPWSVKGIDPKAREVAKDLARRSGMTLGEWLNRMILEDEGPEEITSQSYFDERPRPEAQRPHVLERRPEPLVPPRYEAPAHVGDELDRVALALDRLSRFERDPRPSPAALAAERVMADAMARIEAAEREAVAVAARFEGAVQEARAENSRLADRLRKIEAEAAGPRSVEALRSLEAALGRVASHLYEGESRTQETIRAVEHRIDEIIAKGVDDPAGLIEEVVNRVDARLVDAEARTEETLSALSGAFAALEARVARTEGGLGPDIEGRIANLSAELTRRLEESRGEIARQLQSDVDGRFDRIEKQIGEMAQGVRQAEKVSADAAEKMGREVLAMADALNRQVQAAEHRSADALEQVGGEVARIAQAMESRLGRSETAHAEALEKLGAEIGRITDRLTERIGSSERRAAQAIDDVGEQVARVSERISQRQERSVEDLAERIRQSEERTARLLDEAREKIDRSLAESQRRIGEQALAAVAAPRITREEPPPSPFSQDPFRDLGPAEPSAAPLTLQAFAHEPREEIEAEPEAFGPDPFAEATASAEEFPQTAEPPQFGVEDFEAADGLPPLPQAGVIEDAEAPAAAAPQPEPEVAPVAEIEPETQAASEVESDRPRRIEPLIAEPEPEAEIPAPTLSTREVIEQARAAARAAAAGDAKKAPTAPSKGGKIEKLPKERGKSLFSGLSLRKRGAGGSLQTALLVAGGAAFLSLGAASYFVAEGEAGGAPPKRVADALDVFAKDQAGEIKGGEADTTPAIETARAAVALAPQTLPPQPTSENAEAAGLYASAVRALEVGQAGGLEALRKAANLGHSPAQFYLAKLYAEGGAGLKKDLAEARRWTERAAEGGNRAAMHNLGIAYADGQGGPENAAIAAQWFRRAADLGLVDSQYNLGVLYEQGRGVGQNAAEAYKWYLIAARSGDEQARKNAGRVRASLSAEGRDVAERSAQAFRPTAPNPSAYVEAEALSRADVATAQRALSRLDYYQGPTDGSASPALAMAIAAYQRNEGMAATGKLDQLTLSRLKVFTQ